MAAPALHLPDWSLITGPSGRASRYLPWLLGTATLFLLVTPAVIRSFLYPGPVESAGAPAARVPWFLVVAVMLFSIPAHELLHAAFLPGFPRSASTTLVLWPRRLRFGVFFEGRVSRTRWLLMRSAPFLLLAVLPAALLALSSGDPRTLWLETCLSLLLLLNSLGSGADLVAVLWVATRIPSGTTLLFHGGRAYWRMDAIRNVED